MNQGFSWAMFIAAIDTIRESRSLEWKQVSEQSGVPTKTLAAIRNGKKCDVDTIAMLRQWMAVGVDRFFANGMKS